MSQTRTEFRVNVRFIRPENRGRKTLPGSPYRPHINFPWPDGTLASSSIQLTFDRSTTWHGDNPATLAIIVEDGTTPIRVGDRLDAFEGRWPVAEVEVLAAVDRDSTLASSDRAIVVSAAPLIPAER